MRVAFWSFYENNCIDMKMFHQKDADIAEGIFKKWNTLYTECLKEKIEIIALNMVDDLSLVDFFVFADFPRMDNPIVRKAFQTSTPKILIIEEGPVIHPSNWNIKNHRLFDYIFTWNDDLVDNIRYFKFNVHYIETMQPSFNLKTKLCVLIARNKRAWGKEELYTERRRIIRYFEKHHLNDFDLLGEGWDTYYFPSNAPVLRLFNGSKLFWFRSRMKEKYPSWKGAIENKIEVLRKYKFSISFENSIGPTGYISEKIWDSFAAGTVPVYLGAPNVLQHIPQNCFIDFRDFKTYDYLYEYMNNMPDDRYYKYIDDINAFLIKEAHGGQFSDQYFVNSLIYLLKSKSVFLTN